MEKMKNLNIITVSLAIGFTIAIVAICFFVFHIPDFWPQTLAIIASAFMGAGATAWLTNMLLNNQQESEEKKEKNIKVYEEKLHIYKEFLECLYEIIKDGEVTKEEAIRLEFQTSYITMHTRSEQIKVIAEQIKEIVTGLNGKITPGEKSNSAESESERNKDLMTYLFNIVKEFRKELYQFSPTEKDENNIKEAVNAFRSIMDPVEEKREEKDLEQLDSSADVNGILNRFTDKLVELVGADERIWSINRGELKDGVYLNYAWKSNEEGVRVLLDYENEKHYLAIHLDYHDTHEAYKHMKWRFGGRQNKWCWWKYLESTALVEDILNGNVDISLLAEQFKELLKYLESFERIFQEIYQPAPKEKANVWLYYETYVAFDYDKTLGEDRFFVDVILQDNGSYSISAGNRNNDIDKLRRRLEKLGFPAATEDIEGQRYTVDSNLSAEKAIEKINEIESKIKEP